MKRVYLLFLGLVLILSGCVARTYQLTRDRVDQGMSEGNRGYIMGSHPGSGTPKKTERAVRVFEFELGKTYKTKNVEPVSAMPQKEDAFLIPLNAELSSEPGLKSGSFQKYTVEKNDTLQKISQKFYGTTKKWAKIYEANRDVLKTPDRVYPRQVLNIPEEGMKTPSEALKEPAENLK